MEELDKKYGFWTATAMVVGIVIDSGVFFKADDVLKASGGCTKRYIYPLSDHYPRHLPYGSLLHEPLIWKGQHPLNPVDYLELPCPQGHNER